ncbi:MAG: hypothetical protein ACOC1X_01390 [Promethearchaeota archaeon]
MVKKFGEIRENKQLELDGELLKDKVAVGAVITITEVIFEEIEDMGRMSLIRTKEHESLLRTWSSVLMEQLAEIKDLLKEYEEPIQVIFTQKAGDEGSYYSFQ